MHALDMIDGEGGGGGIDVAVDVGLSTLAALGGLAAIVAAPEGPGEVEAIALVGTAADFVHNLRGDAQEGRRLPIAAPTVPATIQNMSSALVHVGSAYESRQRGVAKALDSVIRIATAQRHKVEVTEPDDLTDLRHAPVTNRKSPKNSLRSKYGFYE
jgi:hypothetical protein